MDLTSIDTAQALSNARLGNEISVRVAKKTLDIARQQGDEAVKLIKAAAANAGAGGRADSVGGRLDVTA